MRFAREEIARRTPELSRWQLRRHRSVVAAVAAIVVDNLVQPGVYASVGLDPEEARKAARGNDHYVAKLRAASTGLVTFLRDVGLIDEHQPCWINIAHLLPPPGARGLVALGGGQAFCFNGRPPRRRRPPGVSSSPGAGGSPLIARDIADSDTGSPPAARNAATCSARVASAAASSRAGSQACSCRRCLGSRPCRCSVAARPPVARRRARYRSTVRSDTPNRSAACDWLIPSSTAATIRSRKSIEYARTPAA